MDNNPRLALRPAAAAQALGVSRTAVYGMLSRGELRSVKAGSSRLIPTAELQKWLERQLTAAGA